MLQHSSLPTKTMESEETLDDKTDTGAKKKVVPNTNEISKRIVAYVNQVAWHTTVRQMECVPT